MALRDEVKKRTGTSKRKALDVLEKYTGNDLDQHRWKVITQEHGRKVHELLSK